MRRNFTNAWVFLLFFLLDQSAKKYTAAFLQKAKISFESIQSAAGVSPDLRIVLGPIETQKFLTWQLKFLSTQSVAGEGFWPVIKFKKKDKIQQLLL